jgi:small-conductance mechanosensitive channel
MDAANPFEALQGWLVSGAWVAIGQRVLVATAIFGVAWLLAHFLRTSLARVRRRAGERAPMIYIVEKVGSLLVLLTGLVASLSALGLDLGSVALFSGAAGVGLGFGLQNVVREFISGLILIFDRLIQIGDFVELENGVRGEIVEITPRATRLRTNDDLNVIVPNSTMIQSRIVNWTFSHETRRIHVPFSTAEWTDKAHVREVVLAAARALPFTLPDGDAHKTQVWLTGFGGNGLDFELIVWPIPDSSRHPASMHAAYTWAIHEALVAAGVENSAPQMDLRVRSLFGRKGDEALHALNLVNGALRPSQATLTDRAPNDAAAAVRDDTERENRERALQQRPRERRQ